MVFSIKPTKYFYSIAELDVKTIEIIGFKANYFFSF